MPGEMKAFALRMPPEMYEAIQRHAQFVNESMNAVINDALRNYFASVVQTEDFERLMDSFRDRYRVALDKLTDL